jgi:hypothetical protein
MIALASTSRAAHAQSSAATKPASEREPLVADRQCTVHPDVILYRDRDAGQEPGGLASIALGGPREGRLRSDDR